MRSSDSPAGGILGSPAPVGTVSSWLSSAPFIVNVVGQDKLEPRKSAYARRKERTEFSWPGWTIPGLGGAGDGHPNYPAFRSVQSPSRPSLQASNPTATGYVIAARSAAHSFIRLQRLLLPERTRLRASRTSSFESVIWQHKVGSVSPPTIEPRAADGGTRDGPVGAAAGHLLTRTPGARATHTPPQSDEVCWQTKRRYVETPHVCRLLGFHTLDSKHPRSKDTGPLVRPAPAYPPRPTRLAFTLATSSPSSSSLRLPHRPCPPSPAPACSP